MIAVRVSVTDVWDTVELNLAPDSTIAALKAAALARATGRPPESPTGHVVKYRGALIADESQTLAGLGVPDRAPFIVLPGRRQPVR
jgi:hypothetical protein